MDNELAQLYETLTQWLRNNIDAWLPKIKLNQNGWLIVTCSFQNTWKLDRLDELRTTITNALPSTHFFRYTVQGSLVGDKRPFIQHIKLIIKVPSEILEL